MYVYDYNKPFCEKLFPLSFFDNAQNESKQWTNEHFVADTKKKITILSYALSATLMDTMLLIAYASARATTCVHMPLMYVCACVLTLRMLLAEIGCWWRTNDEDENDKYDYDHDDDDDDADATDESFQCVWLLWRTPHANTAYRSQSPLKVNTYAFAL